MSVIVETSSAPADSVVIWLHGLGADGHDFESIVPALTLPPELNIRFIFPHAPMMPVTLNQGSVMRAWYDIKSMDIEIEPDEVNINQSVDRVNTLIETQIAVGISTYRMVLAGFSQGGVIALQAGLRYRKKLAGIIALSTYLPLAEKLVTEKSQANQNIPILLAHGQADPVLPISLAYTACEQLKKAGYQPEWREYADMPHSVSPLEIKHISDWLQRVLR